MSFHIDQAARKIEELEGAITANDKYLQKIEAENKTLREQLRLANIDAYQNEAEANKFRESHAELLKALKALHRASPWRTESWAADRAIANAEKLK